MKKEKVRKKAIRTESSPSSQKTSNFKNLGLAGEDDHDGHKDGRKYRTIKT